MRNEMVALLILAILSAALISCSSGGAVSATASADLTAVSDASSDVPETAVDKMPDPKGAIDKIYESIDIMKLEFADDTVMSEIMRFNLDNIYEYFVKYSSGRFGISDVYILMPVGGKESEVREELELRKEARIEESTNYDVHNSQSIAKNAIIYEHGGYLIMLMLEDNDSAAEIIGEYIPDR